MSQRTYCDRCGKEAGRDVVIRARVQLADTPDHDLCSACARALVEWLKVPPAEHEQGHR